MQRCEEHHCDLYALSRAERASSHALHHIWAGAPSASPNLHDVHVSTRCDGDDGNVRGIDVVEA